MSARRVVMCMTCNTTHGWSFEDWNSAEADATIDAWLRENEWVELPKNDRRTSPTHVCATCTHEIADAFVAINTDEPVVLPELLRGMTPAEARSFAKVFNALRPSEALALAKKAGTDAR